MVNEDELKKLIDEYEESDLGLCSISIVLESKEPFNYPRDKKGFLDICSIGGFCFNDICFDFENYCIDTSINEQGHLIMETVSKNFDADYFYSCQENDENLVKFDIFDEKFFKECEIDEIYYEAQYEEDENNIDMKVNSIEIELVDKDGYKVFELDKSVIEKAKL